MRPPPRQVISIEQPVELLTGEREQARISARPVKALAFEPLLPQHKPRALPIQNLAAVAPRVGEHKQLLAERVQRQLLLHQRRQPVYLFPEVHRLDAHIDCRELIRWTHHGSVPTVCRISRSAAALGSPPTSTTHPFRNRSRHIGAGSLSIFLPRGRFMDVLFSFFSSLSPLSDLCAAKQSGVGT